MENYLDHYEKIRNIPLEIGEKRYIEIYKITCSVNGKSYVGQTVSHVIQHNKMYPYGMNGRLKKHFSEANNSSTSISKQCSYLNNAIRKHGEHNFEVALLYVSEIDDSDIYEQKFISECNTLYPTGYNLTSGGKTASVVSLESRKKVSRTLYQQTLGKKIRRFEHLSFEPMFDNQKHVFPLNKYGNQYGWYVLIQNIKADFGGIHIPLDESFKDATDFVQIIKNKLLAKHLVAGNSLEQFTTTCTSKEIQGTRLIAEPNGNNVN